MTRKGRQRGPGCGNRSHRWQDKDEKNESKKDEQKSNGGQSSGLVGYAEGEISRRFEIIEHELRSMRDALKNKNIPDTIEFAGLLIREVKRILELVTSA